MPFPKSSLLTVLSLCFCLLISIGESSRPHKIEYPHHYRRQASNTSSYFPITGVVSNKATSGPVPQRLEIRHLQQQHPYQWNLYLLAMDRFQSMNQSLQRSYYQIGGIHGRPFIQWDNVPFADGRDGGYCTHSSTIFPTWHRPYVALFEQVVYGIVRDIAGNFSGPDRSNYIAAAQNFRVPYWDWAAPAPAGQDVMPTTISSPAMVQVTGPGGNQTIPNPLYQYHFNPLDSSQLPDFPFKTWEYTLRYPDSNMTDASSQDPAIVTQFNNNQASYAKRFLNLLQAYPTYEKFSNKAWMPGVENAPGSYDSLESLHDAIHGLIGNGGHFTYNEYSAFDPVFWLHHANVDRLFAIWQTINPDSYVKSTLATSGTATIIPNVTVVDENTPLTPFHSDTNGTFWTSASSRETTIFGYTYPETVEGNASCTRQAVNHLYGSTSGQPLPKKGKRSGEQKDGIHYEWITNIRVAQNAVASTFSIFVFLGDFNPDPKTWLSEPNLVGTHSVFKPFSYETADQAVGMIVAGTVPLSTALKSRNSTLATHVNTSNSTEIEAYLNDNLHWRIARLTDNVEIPREAIESLKVSVVSCPVTIAKNDHDFPDWGDCQTHAEITDGRAGGLQNGEPS